MRAIVSALLMVAACSDPGTPGSDEDDAGPGSGGDDSDGGSGPDTGGSDCTEVVMDGGFEEGPLGEAWAQGSAVFDTVICDASCVEGPSMAYAGAYWVFFGGQAIAESAYVSQTVPIVGTSATLAFQLRIDTNAETTYSDSLTVLLDNENLLTVDNTMVADYEEYTRVELDVSEFAGAQSHPLSFDANFSGSDITSFFLDEVSLLACDD